LACEKGYLTLTSQQPFFSVVLGNYNYAHYLGEAIESVLSQSYPHFELVIVDDGSTDDSREVINRYAHAHRDKIRPIFTQNRGQASAMSVGVLNARGDFVCFIDSDDRFCANKLATIADYVARYPTIDGIVHRARIFGDHRVHEGLYEASETWPSARLPRQPHRVSNRLAIDDYHIFFTISSCMIFNRDMAARIARFRSDLWTYKHYGDVYFSRLAYVLGTILAIPDLLTEYRLHGAAIHLNSPSVRSKGKPLNMQRLIEEHYAYVNEFLRHEGCPELQLRHNLKWLTLATQNDVLPYATFIRAAWHTTPALKTKLKYVFLGSKTQLVKRVPWLRFVGFARFRIWLTLRGRTFDSALV
jgi:glycosyltransferase involved in cell wall biosynthesis